MRRLGFLLAFATGACGGTDTEPPASFSVFDSAGVQIVDNHAPSWSAGEAWRFPAEPLVRIGPHREGPVYELWRVTNVRRLEDGSVAVLNSGSNELRIYGPSGDHVRTYGKQGPGPGEFERAWGLQVDGDTLMVLDGTGSVSYFHPEDGFVREVGRLAVFDRPYSPDHLLPDGSVTARRVLRMEGPPVGPYRPPFEIVLGTPDGELASFGTYGGVLQERIGEGREQTSVVPPFAPTAMYHVQSDRSLLAVGDNVEYAIRIFDLEGTLQRIVRKTEPLEPVTPADVEAWKDVQRGLEWTRGQLPQLERQWLQVTIPETKPAYGPFTFARSGELWVGHPVIDGEPLTVYSVFDARGVWLGDVDVPPGLRHWYREVDISDGFFLGVWVDESGLEEVRVYALEQT